MPRSTKIYCEELKRRETATGVSPIWRGTYLRDGAAKYISQQTFGEGDFRDLNETTFNLTTDPDVFRHAVAAAEQLPMMASRRLVRITGVRISATGFRDTVLEEHEDLLRSFLTDPSPSSVLVFIADELNGNRKMSKLLKSFARRSSLPL